MLLSAQRAAVAQACQQLLASGLVRGTSGNVSVRDPGSGAIAVSPSGVPYPGLTAVDVPVLDAEGHRLDGELQPTSEVALHLGIYRARPEVCAVVHTHSMFATVFAALGEQIPPVHYQLARAGSIVPIAPYARYGSLELAESCVRTLAGRDAVLLANHGVVAVGGELTQAIAVAESVEYVAELAWRCRLVGNPQLLDQAQLAEAEQAFSSYGRQPG
ncbi:MAG: class II aldolase/adducin family protein [Actinomycetota bacterium]|nr:class II aldolase/adducin family protein [Actinomycetota bacterium]MDQ2956343.1 class II aldolase/adducin family protein [Actinomycetota bacterium]